MFLAIYQHTTLKCCTNYIPAYFGLASRARNDYVGSKLSMATSNLKNITQNGDIDIEYLADGKKIPAIDPPPSRTVT